MDRNEPYVHEFVLAGLERYVKQRIRPGPFLEAVLCNKLKEAYQLADDYNEAHLYHLVKYLYWEIPGLAWGSEKKYKDWLKGKHEKTG